MEATSAFLKTARPRNGTKRILTLAGPPVLGPFPPRAGPDPADLIVLMAVEALDGLVADMIQQNRGKIPRDFFDWVADDMTPQLENMALAHFEEHGWPGMAAASETRDWVRALCQRPLEQKLKGMSLRAARQIPDGADLTRASRAG